METNEKPEVKKTLPDYFKEVFHNPKDLVTVPNLLVYLRILLAIVFLVFYILGINVSYATGEWTIGVTNDSEHYLQIEGYIACAIILTCGFTDFLDGYIARKFNQQTDFGVLMDPVADKLLQVFIVIGIAVRWSAYPIVWVLLGVLVCKELFMLLNNLLIWSFKAIHFQKAYWYGKASTLILYLTMAIMLFFVNWVQSDSTSFSLFVNLLCAVCTAALLFAWLMYGLKYLDMWRHPEKYLEAKV